jgi:general stress protein 26
MHTNPSDERTHPADGPHGSERSAADAHAHLWTLISDMRFAMFITRNPHGQLSARPLTTQNTGDQGGGGVLEYFVSANSDLASHIASDDRVCSVYANPGDDRYVSVSGHAQLRQDPSRQRQLWSKMAQAWFPGGADDTDLRLLSVSIDAAEYWDIQTSKMVQLLKMASAAVTGKPPTDLGEHREVHPA